MNMRCSLVALLVAASCLGTHSASARDERKEGEQRNLVSESSPTFSHLNTRPKDFNPQLGVWYSGAFAPQQASFTFSSPRTITRMTFKIEQNPPGETDHVLLINGRLVYRFSGFTRDNQVLIYSATLDDVLNVTIRTLKSPSHIAWRGIEIFGY